MDALFRFLRLLQPELFVHLDPCRPVAWVVASEIFPLNIRGKQCVYYCMCIIAYCIEVMLCSCLCVAGTAVSITTAANWIGNFTIAMATPLLLGSNWGLLPGTAGTFLLLSGFLVTAFLFVLLMLPETKVVMHSGEGRLLLCM